MKIVTKIALLSGILALTACATGRTPFDKGQHLEQSGRYDEAVLKYAEAVSNNPGMSEYRLAFLKASEQAARMHLRAGDDLLVAKRYAEAFNEYQRAMALDPALDRARQQVEQLKKYRNSQLAYDEGLAFEKENKTREAVRSYQKSLSLNSANKEAADALERLLKTRKPRAEGFELNLKSAKPITLKFKDAKVKDVFNIISQLSGINFIFDEAMKDSSVTVFLENATFQQALDIICGMQKLSRKILNENTIIVYQKTPDKTKQYEELYVQTFFLNKLDAKKAVNLIRTMLQVKKIYVNEEMNTLVIRDTLDVIEVARRILEANDVPDAEVVLEVEVIELAKKNTESFGLALSKYAVGMNLQGPNGFLSDTFTTATAATSGTGTSAQASTTSTATPSQLLNLFRWGDYRSFITVPSATFNFGKALGNAETLSNPKIRVKNREKAKFNVGTRVPITTTSSNGVGNYNVNVQYVDVGVKINAEPTIQLNNDVNIKLGLEVSSILSKEKVGTDQNTQVVTIGTRNMDTVLSLKDGETSIIGGLIQDTKGQNTNKVFLLGDIPVIGPLFSSHDNSGDKTELILAITPRIVRGITVSDAEVASFWSGLEDDPSVSRYYSSFVQEPEFAPAAAKAPLAQPAAPPSQQPAAQPAPQIQTQAAPAISKPTPAVPVVDQRPVADATQSAPAPVAPQAPTPAEPAKQMASKPATELTAPVPPPQVKRVAIRVSSPAVVKQGQLFVADVMASEADNLFAAPLTVVFDPSILEALAVTEGDLFKKDGKSSQFTSKVDNQAGQVAIKLSREPDAAGVTGSGRLFSVNFRAKSKGPASIGFIGAKLTGQDGKPIDSTLYNAVVEVKQP